MATTALYISYNTRVNLTGREVVDVDIFELVPLEHDFDAGDGVVAQLPVHQYAILFLRVSRDNIRRMIDISLL